MDTETCNCSPGYRSANLGSAVVKNAVDSAKRADRIALLSRMRAPDCCPPKASAGAAQASNDYLTNRNAKIIACSNSLIRADISANGVNSIGNINGRSLLSSVYLKNKLDDTIAKESDPFNPDTRFSRYNRYQPPAPCPTYQGNSAVPYAPTSYCYPTRFTGNPRTS